MSFQRPLTGESAVIATVVLNTNISANSVSTVNLSATNASFTNITTNTWTAGNVSTPNVIATTAYFSNLNASIVSISNFNISKITVTNASITNLSTSYINASSTTNYVTNASFVNACLGNFSTLNNIFMYSNYVSSDYFLGTSMDVSTINTSTVSAISVSTPTINTSLITTKTLNSTSIYTSFIYSSRVNACNFSGENASITLGEIVTVNSFYTNSCWVASASTNLSKIISTSIYVSNLNVSFKANISNLSVSNFSANVFGITNGSVINLSSTSITTTAASITNLSTSFINASTTTNYTTNASFVNSCLNNTSTTYTSYYYGMDTSSVNYYGTQATLTSFTGFDTNSCYVYSASANISRLKSTSITTTNLSVTNNASFITITTEYISTIYCIVSDLISVSNLSVLNNASFNKATADIMSIENLSVTNLGIVGTGDFTVNGSVIGSNGIFRTMKLINNASAVQYSISQVGDGIVHNTEVGSINQIHFMKQNASLATLNTSQALFWNPVSAPTITAEDSDPKFNMYVSNASGRLQVGEMGLKSIPAYNFSGFYLKNTCELVPLYLNLINQSNYAMKMDWDAVYVPKPLNSSTLYASNSSITNLTNTCLYASYISASLTYTSNLSAKSSNISTILSTNFSTTYASVTDITVGNEIYYKAGSALAYESYATNGALSGAVIHNTLDVGTARHKFQYLGDDLMSINSSQILAYKNFYSASSLFVSSGNVCNFSVSNLSVTTLSIGTVTSGNTSVAYLSVTTELTAELATIPRLNSTSTFVSNLSASNASITGRITVSNISTTSISATGRINADNIRAGLDIVTANGKFSGGFGDITNINSSNIYVSLQIHCSTASCRSISSASTYTSWVNASNSSIVTLSSTSIYASNGNFSTLNASTFTLVNTSITNLSVLTEATIVSLTSSNIYPEVISLIDSNTSIYGQFWRAGVSLILETQNPLTNNFLFRTANSNRLELNASGLKSYVSFFVSRGNFSVLSVSNFNPNTITTTTVNASTGNFSTLSVSTFNPATITTTTISTSELYASTIYAKNISDVNRIDSGGPLSLYNDGIYINSAYASLGGIPYMQMNYWKTSISATDQGFTMYADELRGSVMDGGNLPFTIRSSDFIQSTTTSTSGWYFYNKINTSFQTNFSKLAVSNLSASSASIVDLAVSNLTLTNTSIANLTVSSQLTIPMNVSTNNNSGILTIYGNTINTTGAGIRVPNYIDGVDTGSGITIGYNQTGGFVNVCRGARFYSNILTDSNLNTITNTATLGIGQNITTGDIKIGSTTMTGNISIDTTGYINKGCDLRSTWNTSDLISYSTQLGSNYSNSNLASTGNISGTNACRLYYPSPTNISLQNVPVGLYLVTGVGAFRGFNGYNAIAGNCYAGVCYGTNASFTDANTTRITPVYYFAPNLYSNASTATVIPFNFAYVLNMSITGQKIGIFSQYQATNLATAGNVAMSITNITVTKIA